MKFKVYVRFERTEVVEVEAPTAGDAREIVMTGEFTEKQVVETHDDDTEIIDVVKVVKTKKS